MAILGDALGMVTNVASGGIFGLVGSLIGVGAKWLQAKQAAAQKAADQAHELALLQLQLQQGREETEHELAIVSQQGAWQGLSVSYAHDTSAGPVYRWVASVLRLFRPFLTVFLWGLAGWIFLELVRGRLDGVVDGQALIAYMVNSVVFAASTATVWWFGDRAMTPPGTRGR